MLDAKYERIGSLVEGFKHYIEYGTQTGVFLRSVIANDLRLACAAADQYGKEQLALIVEFCEANLPDPAWGSAAAVHDWLAMSQEERFAIVTTSRWYRAAEILSETQAKQQILADQETKD